MKHLRAGSDSGGDPGRRVDRRRSRLRRGALVALALAVAGLVATSAAPRVGTASGLSQTKVRGRVLAVQVAAPAAASVLSRSAVPSAVPGTSPGAVGRLDPGWRFNMVGAVLTLTGSGRQLPTVAVRTGVDGRWSAWEQLSFEAEPGGVRFIADPLWVGDARLLEYRVAGGSGAAQFSFINSLGDATTSDQVASALRGAAAAIIGCLRSPAAHAATTAPRIVTRQQWGADETWRQGEASYAPVKMAFVHHTVSGNSYTQAQSPAVVRAIYYYHTKSCGFRDIGYNFLIDRYGTIYEGRYGGVARGVIGAQTLGFNTGSTGIAFIGDFRTATPPAAAITALEKLLAWKLDVHHVNPLGRAKMVCGAADRFAEGQSVTFNVISGHRDACYTTCPGNALYAKLPTVRAVAAATGLPKLYGFIPSSAAISPNGNGTLDTLTVPFTLSETADWKVDVSDAGGSLVREFTGSGTAATVKWDGHDAAGAQVADGTYTLTATASCARGSVTPATATVLVETTRTALTLKSATVTPAYNTLVSLSGGLLQHLDRTSIAAAAVTLERSPDGAAWSELAQLTTDAAGAFSFADPTPVTVRTYYRVRFAGDDSFDAAAAVLRVVPRVALTAPSAPSAVTVLAPFSVSGTLRPALPAGAKPLTLRCYRLEAGKWVLRRTYTLTSVSKGAYSAYTLRFSLPGRGSWRLRASFAGSTLNSATLSNPRALLVR